MMLNQAYQRIFTHGGIKILFHMKRFSMWFDIGSWCAYPTLCAVFVLMKSSRAGGFRPHFSLPTTLSFLPRGKMAFTGVTLKRRHSVFVKRTMRTLKYKSY